MKKIALILLILITAATSVLAYTPIDYTDEIEEADIQEEEPLFPELQLPDDLEKKPDFPGLKKAENVKKDTFSDKISEINSLHDDKQKVKEWAKLSSKENYVIIDKKDCSATVYDKNGEEIKSFEIGIGREIGDDFNDTSGLLGKSKNTTPAGEFTLIPNIYNKSAYGDLTLSLGADANKAHKTKKVVAIHKVPKFREKERLKKFDDGNLANNRMSYGCINLLEDDFKELTKYIKGGFKLYVLPEEEGNHLTLTKNDKDKYELTQTKY